MRGLAPKEVPGFPQPLASQTARVTAFSALTLRDQKQAPLGAMLLQLRMRGSRFSQRKYGSRGQRDCPLFQPLGDRTYCASQGGTVQCLGRIARQRDLKQTVCVEGYIAAADCPHQRQ